MPAPSHALPSVADFDEADVTKRRRGRSAFDDPASIIYT